MSRKYFLVLIPILLIVILLVFFFKKDTNYNLKIHFFNIGKADSILINYNEKNILIDTGYNTSSQIITNYLKEKKITVLDYLIITHFDKDHVGSASDIINNFEIDNVLQSNYPKESEYYNNYINALNENNIIPQTITDNKSFSLDDIVFNVNGPNKIYEKNESNNSSLIVSFEYKNNSFIFTGDIENERINDFVSLNNKTYDFIKIPHHGNYHKKLKDLIENIKPKYAIITSSNEELEEVKTINLLEDKSIKYYLTRNGDIDLYSDGNTIKIIQ